MVEEFNPKFPPFVKYPDAKVVYCTHIKIAQYEVDLFIVEFPPAVRNIIERVDSYDVRSRSLSFPYVELVVLLSPDFPPYIKAFYRKHPLTRSSNSLYMVNLPNVSPNGGTCMVRNDIEIVKPVSKQIELSIESFWESPFTKELMGAWKHYAMIPDFPSTFYEWERKSQLNPAFMLNLSFLEIYADIRLMINDI